MRASACAFGLMPPSRDHRQRAYLPCFPTYRNGSRSSGPCVGGESPISVCRWVLLPSPILDAWSSKVIGYASEEWMSILRWRRCEQRYGRATTPALHHHSDRLSIAIMTLAPLGAFGARLDEARANPYTTRSGEFMKSESQEVPCQLSTFVTYRAAPRFIDEFTHKPCLGAWLPTPLYFEAQLAHSPPISAPSWSSSGVHSISHEFGARGSVFNTSQVVLRQLVVKRSFGA